MKTETPVTSNAFETVLRTQRRGLMAHELSEKISELTKSCRELLKPGKLTLTLTLTPRDGEGAAFTVIDEIRIKLPEPNRSASIFYATEAGQLVRDNPAQQDLDLRVIETNEPKPQQQPQTESQQA